MIPLNWKRYAAIAGLIAIGALVVFVALPQITPLTSQQSAQQRGGGGGGGFRRGGQSFNEGPVPVLAAAARNADVPVYLDGVGTAKALNTVTVRAQVDGKLLSVSFAEGQDVPKGYVLARIDPATYQAQYDQALAKKAQDEALLANARIDLDRYRRLAESNAGPRQQADTQASTVSQLEAQVKSDQASIENFKAILDYTTIIAPIAGRTGLRQVDEGNIVKASDANGLVTITQLKPISVLFSLPQQQLREVNRAFALGPLPVEILDGDNKAVIDRGILQVVDNQVDPTTGTVKLKAEFPNATMQQWPGQFVNVRLLVDTLKDAIVVPTAAVQRGPNGTFVYIVNDGDTVSVRPITVTMQDDTQAVIASGLKTGERVVTTGVTRLSEGASVTVGQGEAPDMTPLAPGSERQPRGRRNQDGAPQSQRRRGGNTEGTSSPRQ